MRLLRGLQIDLLLIVVEFEVDREAGDYHFAVLLIFLKRIVLDVQNAQRFQLPQLANEHGDLLLGQKVDLIVPQDNLVEVNAVLLPCNQFKVGDVVRVED